MPIPWSRAGKPGQSTFGTLKKIDSNGDELTFKLDISDSIETVELTKSGGTTTSYGFTYDALGVRKTKTVNGVTTRYFTAPIFGYSHVLMELGSDNTIKSTFAYAGNQLLKQEFSTSDRDQDRCLFRDGMVGSITHAVDRQGVVREEYRYDPFGARTTVMGANNRYGFTGEEFDDETGLLYLRARYYDSSLGRFISADPYAGRVEEPVTQNRYIYVQNNPLLYADPSGMDTLSLSTCNSAGAGSFVTTCNAVNMDFSGGYSATTHVGGGSFLGASLTSVINITWTNGSDVSAIPGNGSQEGVSFRLFGADVGIGAVQGENGVIVGYFEIGGGSGTPYAASVAATNTV